MDKIKLPNYNKHRPFFTDGWNSAWHFFFGLLSIEYTYIIPLFVIYQLLDIYDRNMFIDMTEFFIGYLTAIFVRGLTCNRVRFQNYK
jgi:hypothetical protein